MLSLGEVVRLLKVDSDFVWKLVDEGYLHPVCKDGVYYFDEDEVMGLVDIYRHTSVAFDVVSDLMIRKLASKLGCSKSKVVRDCIRFYYKHIFNNK